MAHSEKNQHAYREGEAMLKKLEEESRKKNEEERKFKDKQNPDWCEY